MSIIVPNNTVHARVLLRRVILDGRSPRTLILGMVIGDLVQDGTDRLWQGAILSLPNGNEPMTCFINTQRVSVTRQPNALAGWRADQILTGPFSDDSMWREER